MGVKGENYREHSAGPLRPLGEAFLAMLDRDQRRLLRLCAALEKIADGLPATLPQRRTARVLSFLNKAFNRHIFLHEKCLFPIVRSLAEARAAIEPVLAQLEYEHASDHGLVLEITSAFVNESRGETGIGAHILGFLLRSFFENYRRHHAWEKEILYPFARKLTDGTFAARHDGLLRVSFGL